MSEGTSARLLEVFGTVQGVGFRPFVYRLATEMDLAGWVQNRSGDVAVHLEGPAAALDEFERRLRAEKPALATIDRLAVSPAAIEGRSAFEILPSVGVAGGYQPVSPDVALCPDCRREMLTPGNPRFLYPFINCTSCGPRYTIIERVPYDRCSTTMKDFPMCPLCRSQYEDPWDRRFHAQPVACESCGPQVWLEAPGAEVVSGTTEVLREAARRIRQGQVLAIKGLGGFHLAVDATSDGAVALLRERKRRPDKALAVMVADEEMASTYCHLSPLTRQLLASPQAPIVLLPVREGTEQRLSSRIAPDHSTVGVMLPYTPLHLLLMREVGVPLVMTSGNLSEEPLSVENDEARRRLDHIADAWLLHDRPIHMPVDDSVVATVTVGDRLKEEIAQVVRRARGYAPAPLALLLDGPQVLAVGPEMKATVCLARDRLAFTSQHIGDLDNAQTYDHFVRVVRQFEGLFSVRPEVIAHDLHPDFASTHYARERSAKEGQVLVPVQHHHAHALSCVLDARPELLREPVLAVVLDGTGYGSDETIWGGEWLLVSGPECRRATHLRNMPLVGGDAAIRRVDRLAATYLLALGEADEAKAIPQLEHLLPGEWELLAAGVAGPWAVPTSSMGRLFDVVAALLGLAREVTYEAQAAIRLETLARRATGEVEAYPWELRQGEVDLSGILGGVLDDLRGGRPTEQMALAFHSTVAEMVVEICSGLAQDQGIAHVALSGGCLQNALLTSLCTEGLRTAGLEPLLHRQLPPNDGCVSVGQAVAARLRLQAS